MRVSRFPPITACAGTVLCAAVLCGAAPMTMADPITFTDMANREVTLDGVPQRVVSAASPAGSMVVTVTENGETLVGTTPNSHGAIKEGVLDEFFPALDNLRSDFLPANGSVNIEAVLQMEPDLVLQWARDEKSIAALEAAGLTVAGMRYAKLDIAKNWLTDLGIMFERSDKVDEILAWHDRRYQEIIAKTGTIAEEDKPSVLYLLAPMRAAGPGSHFQVFMDTAGAKNALPVDGKFVDLDPEMLLLANPDIIWLFGFNMKMLPETIYNNPLYADINAVKNRRIYKVPVGGDRWDPPNQEFPLGWEWFTRTAHPDLLPGSIRDSIRAAYPMLYGHTPTDEQLDMMLRVGINAGAADYETIVR